MPEFLNLLPPEEALARWLDALPPMPDLGIEKCPSDDSLHRILAADIQAPESLPPFSRSTVDGYAIRAVDSFGASPSLPAYLTLTGEVLMGRGTDLALDVGQAVLIHTGGMIPSGADAVVMLEDTQAARRDEIEVLKPAAVGQNILVEGEDVEAGQVVLHRGFPIRAQEIGGLIALGIEQVDVVRKPRVGIISTGDELVPPGARLAQGQVRDINSYTLSALVSTAGGQVAQHELLPDDPDILRAKLASAFRDNDLVVVTAGSSVSDRDLTTAAIDELGEPGVLVHGINIKPGKPTILAVAEGKPILGLPGNPVSAFIVAGIMIPPLLARMLGVKLTAITPTCSATLSVNVASSTGREDFVPVRLRRSEAGLIAEPVYGRSNLIFTLIRADGLIHIPPQATGVPQDAPVEVMLFDPTHTVLRP